MTTSQSPLRILKAQADNIAKMLKAAERGEKIEGPFAEKIAEARKTASFKPAIVMDDKVLTLDIAWDTIRATSETALSEYILDYMRGKRAPGETHG